MMTGQSAVSGGCAIVNPQNLYSKPDSSDQYDDIKCTPCSEKKVQGGAYWSLLTIRYSDPSVNRCFAIRRQERVMRIFAALSMAITFRFTNFYDITIGRINQNRISEKSHRWIVTFKCRISALIPNANHP